MKVYTTTEDTVVVDISSTPRAYVQLEVPTTGILMLDDASAEQLEYAIRAARIGAQAINIGVVRPREEPPRMWFHAVTKHEHEFRGDDVCVHCGDRKAPF